MISTKRFVQLSLLFLVAASSLFVNAAQQENLIRGEVISAEFPYESQTVEVLGSQMHYVDVGEGDPVLFIHGNPTSSYLYRNIIPHVSGDYRAIAIDLIGMGKSDKPDIDYTYLDHRRYVNAFIAALELENITFVIQDWGSVLGFDYAMNNQANTKGVAFMEAILPPASPSATEPGADSLFGRFRTEGAGEELIYDQNIFVEQVLPGGMVRELTQVEHDYYREPYLERDSRKPVLLWPRELPMGGTPAANVEIVTDIGEWMLETDLPMLHFWARPGALNPQSVAEYYADNIKNIQSVFLGEGRHYLQEDHPEMIGRSLNDWIRRLDR